MIDYTMYTRQNPLSAPNLESDLGMDFDECEMTPCWCGKPGCTYGQKKKEDDEPKAGLKQAKADEHKAIPELDPDDALLCPGRVKGFALTEKLWAEFRVDALEEIKWNKEAYERLEMDESTKQIIEALVESHRKHSKFNVAEFDDIIAGKGLGLVLLLQGPPGLGKTLTAESVAEQSERAIYAVTSGELGTTVNDMEAALKSAFRIAKEWNAILLLDEADVFLSRRSTENLEKNAFVSVFLRLMEYYQGILFLTTNRAEDFDPAFLSRIHLTIEYQPLTPERRANVWRNLAARMNRDSSLEGESAPWLKLGQNYAMNGREIKNALRTAYCLAKVADKPLDFERIVQVLELNPRFRSGAGSEGSG
jgi:SpoVK/Ycf46/Vps4 family AAA+-type ATPase